MLCANSVFFMAMLCITIPVIDDTCFSVQKSKLRSMKHVFLKAQMLRSPLHSNDGLGD